MRGFGSQSSASFAIRAQVRSPFWLRRLSVQRQRSMISARKAPSAVGWHCVVVEEAGDDLLQPFTLFRDRLMHPPSQFPCNILDLRLHAVATGPPLEEESAPSRLAAYEGHAEEVEGLRFAEPTLLAVDCHEATKLNQAGL